MSQWKPFLVAIIFLVGLIPTASSQAAVAYSMSFTNGQVQLDVRPGAGFHSEVEFTSLIRNETNSSLEEYETLQYSNNENITDNNRIFSITVTVDWEMKNLSYHNFSMIVFNENQTSDERSGSMEISLQVNENLTMGELAWGKFLNETDFENSFLRTPPSIDMEFKFSPKSWDPDNDNTWTNEVSFNVTTEIITWEFTDIMPASRGCTEIVISNEGQATIDVDVSLSGGGVTISPAMVSVTLAPGGSVTKEICAHAIKMVSYKTVQVNALGSGRETNTQLNQVNKNAGFAVIIQQFAKLSLAPDKLVSDVCLGKNSDVNFTVVNLGNYQDTVAMEITNGQTLEESGFTVALTYVQYQIDSRGEQPVSVKVNSTELGNNSVLNFSASTTLQGETESATGFTYLNVIDCENGNSDNDSDLGDNNTGVEDNNTDVEDNGLYEGDEAGECSDGADNDQDGLFDCDDDTCTGSPACKNIDAEEEDSRLPTLSLLTVLSLLGIISIVRRR